MPDIRNPVLLVAPTSHMPGLTPEAGQPIAELFFNEWNGDPDVWAPTRAGTFPGLTFALLRAAAVAIETVLATPGAAPLVVSDSGSSITVHSGSLAGRDSITLVVNGSDPFYVDIASGYAASCARAMKLQEFAFL